MTNLCDDRKSRKVPQSQVDRMLRANHQRCFVSPSCVRYGASCRITAARDHDIFCQNHKSIEMAIKRTAPCGQVSVGRMPLMEYGAWSPTGDRPQISNSCTRLSVQNTVRFFAAYDLGKRFKTLMRRRAWHDRFY